MDRQTDYMDMLLIVDVQQKMYYVAGSMQVKQEAQLLL